MVREVVGVGGAQSRSLSLREAVARLDEGGGVLQVFVPKTPQLHNHLSGKIQQLDNGFGQRLPLGLRVLLREQADQREDTALCIEDRSRHKVDVLPPFKLRRKILKVESLCFQERGLNVAVVHFVQGILQHHRDLLRVRHRAVEVVKNALVSLELSALGLVSTAAVCTFVHCLSLHCYPCHLQSPCNILTGGVLTVVFDTKASTTMVH